MNDIALIGVDWGSTSVRAFAIARDGAIRQTRRADDGVFARRGDFPARLRALLGDWPKDPPILTCGMVGSDRGWVQAPYVPAPAGLDDLAKHLVPVAFERPALIVPGVSFVDGRTCEVMRGEETIVMGLAPRTTAACLPGTHSKWVDIGDGRITGFRTYMTGELRKLVLEQGALAVEGIQDESDAAFADGLAASEAGATNALFQGRARRLLGHLPAAHTASFVTGVLIGDELRHEKAVTDGPLTLVAQGAIAKAYDAALARAGRARQIMDPEVAVARGLWCIAQAAQLV